MLRIMLLVVCIMLGFPGISHAQIQQTDTPSRLSLHSYPVESITKTNGSDINAIEIMRKEWRPKNVTWNVFVAPLDTQSITSECTIEWIYDEVIRLSFSSNVLGNYYFNLETLQRNKTNKNNNLGDGDDEAIATLLINNTPHVLRIDRATDSNLIMVLDKTAPDIERLQNATRLILDTVETNYEFPLENATENFTVFSQCAPPQVGFTPPEEPEDISYDQKILDLKEEFPPKSSLEIDLNPDVPVAIKNNIEAKNAIDEIIEPLIQIPKVEAKNEIILPPNPPLKKQTASKLQTEIVHNAPDGVDIDKILFGQSIESVNNVVPKEELQNVSSELSSAIDDVDEMSDNIEAAHSDALSPLPLPEVATDVLEIKADLREAKEQTPPDLSAVDTRPNRSESEKDAVIENLIRKLQILEAEKEALRKKALAANNTGIMPDLITCKPQSAIVEDLQSNIHEDVASQYKNTIKVLRDENDLLLEELDSCQQN